MAEGRSAGIRANILLSGDQFLQQSNFQQTHPQLVLLAMGFQGPQKEVLEQLGVEQERGTVSCNPKPHLPFSTPASQIRWIRLHLKQIPCRCEQERTSMQQACLECLRLATAGEARAWWCGASRRAGRPPGRSMSSSPASPRCQDLLALYCPSRQKG